MDYNTRSNELGLAPKDTIKSIVENHLQLQKINPIFLDVRGDAELLEAKLNNRFPVAHIPVTITDTRALEENIYSLFPIKRDPIIIFCRSGRRAAVAKNKLEMLGYDHVYNAGGIGDLTYL